MDGDGWRVLRYPYLHEGETVEKRRQVAAFLKARGYAVAQVTMNFDDWAFSDPYARCRAKGDEAAVGWMNAQYLRRARESLARDANRARAALGRDIPHVLLLHAGAVTADRLPDLLALLGEQGFDLVTLEDAQRDAAYAVVPDRAFPSGATWLDQLEAMKGLSSPRPADDTLTRLQGLCR
jgi:hypothetical protein